MQGLAPPAVRCVRVHRTVSSTAVRAPGSGYSMDYAVSSQLGSYTVTPNSGTSSLSSTAPAVSATMYHTLRFYVMARRCSRAPPIFHVLPRVTTPGAGSRAQAKTVRQSQRSRSKRHGIIYIAAQTDNTVAPTPRRIAHRVTHPVRVSGPPGGVAFQYSASEPHTALYRSDLLSKIRWSYFCVQSAGPGTCTRTRCHSSSTGVRCCRVVQPLQAFF